MLKALCGIQHREKAMDALMVQTNWKFEIVPHGRHNESRHSNDVVELHQNIVCRPFACPAATAK